MSHETDRIVEAAKGFVQGWEYLVQDLHHAYDCTMTCNEAEVLADLFRVFGKDDLADYIIEEHTSTDEPGDAHYSE